MTMEATEKLVVGVHGVATGAIARTTSAACPFAGMAARVYRKILRVVIERRRIPHVLCVAHETVMRKIVRDMVWIRHAIVVALVAGITIGTCAGQIAGVALRTLIGNGGVSAQQRITGVCRMVECRWYPTGRRMTALARCRERQPGVIGIERSRVVGLMARITIGRRVGVTGRMA